MNIYPSNYAAAEICPGSVRLSENIKREDNEYSLLGKTLHEVVALSIINGKFSISEDEIVNLSDEAGFATEEDDYESEAIKENLYAINDCLGFAEHLIRENPEHKILVEDKLPRMDLPDAVSNAKIDFALVKPFNAGIVVDWKFTNVNPPPAKFNLQLADYAYRLHKLYDFASVEVNLVLAFNDYVSTWTYSGDDFKFIRERIELLAAAAQKPWSPYVVSKTSCNYCPAKLICPELAVAADSDDFKNDVKSIAPSSIGPMLDAVHAPAIFAGALKQQAFKVLSAGGAIPGWALLPGKSNRTWAEDVSVDSLTLIGTELGKKVDGLAKTELISPFQLEKKWGKSKEVKSVLKELVESKEGKLTLTRIGE